MVYVVVLSVFGFMGACFFVGGTYHWLDARNQRRRALVELRTARRLRRSSDESWKEYLKRSEELLRTYHSMSQVWTQMYGTPFPVKAPVKENQPPN